MAVWRRTAALAALVLCAVGAAMTPRHHEYCIVGAGPAGVQLAYFLHTSPEPRDYIVFERAANAGSYFETYPRHRTLISINKRFTGHEADRPWRTSEFNMRHDWNSLLNDEGLLFGNYSAEYLPPADDLVRYLGDFVEASDLNIKYDSTVTTIDRVDGRCAQCLLRKKRTAAVVL